MTKAFNPTSVAAGTPSTLTITIGNDNAAAFTFSAPLTDTFPSGLVVAAAPNESTTCGGVVTAVAATDSVTLDATGFPIPDTGFCTVTVDVEASSSNDYFNSMPAGALQTSAGANTVSADATLTIP